MGSQDYEEFIAALNDHGVQYLIVGAHAVAFHARPRATKNLDILFNRALACVLQTSRSGGNSHNIQQPLDRRGTMTKEWLLTKITIEGAEQKHLVKNERLRPNPVPFGFQHDEWLRFKEQIRDGDELWEFSSPAETWEHLWGRAGICIVRNGEVVDSIVTVMN